MAFPGFAAPAANCSPLYFLLSPALFFRAAREKTGVPEAEGPEPVEWAAGATEPTVADAPVIPRAALRLPWATLNEPSGLFLQPERLI